MNSFLNNRDNRDNIQTKYGQVFDIDLDYNLKNIKSLDEYDNSYSQENILKIQKKEIFQNMINDYFDNLYFQKIKDEKGDSIYMCKLPCNLINEYRYIILFTDQDDKQLKYYTRMKNLDWKCIQSRQIKDRYDITLPVQTYKYKDNHPYNTKIFCTTQTETQTKYNSKEFDNIEVVLLSKKSDSFLYPKIGTISSAIETYKTIIIVK